MTDGRYPGAAGDRDAWILARRPERNRIDENRAYAALLEAEPGPDGVVRNVATVFLSNRECPYRCLMCDLWKNTLPERVRPGAIPRQLDAALAGMPDATAIKLYNAGSFFDAKAIPPEDFAAIAQRLRAFERVIVECHPALVGPPVERFRDLIDGALEVAMGLEVADDDLLARLNKRMTLASYVDAARKLRRMGVASRAFVLVQPPFVTPGRAVPLAVASARFAFAHGAGAVSLIPVRAGNGALDALAAVGDFTEPSLATIEDAFDGALAQGGGRVFTDVWDLERFSSCPVCFGARAGRIREMNLSQRPVPRAGSAACAACAACGHAPAARTSMGA
ncbi:MAG TPA: radical SAM protein [Gemmatimonadaceae bacterium]|nr:radical SAM protein [Gemmatimonadaceae bacterium]